MPKRILSQTLKRSKLNMKEKPSELPSGWSKIRDLVVTLGTASGILTGVLWLGGRFYAFGYFSRLNIPIYFLNFLFGEYAENYILYNLVGLVTFIIKNFYVFAISILASSILAFLYLWITRKRNKANVLNTVSRIENINNKFLTFVLVLVFLYSFINAYRGGDLNASYVLDNRQSITVYSKDFLPLGMVSVITAPDQSSSLYEFTGLYLLTYNSGKYYFFKELDLTTCKPKDVYVISDTDSISVNISNITATSAICKP